MKDFCKWLGVNEKIAKIVVWVFIGMIFLIITNTMLESLGFPYYKITAENLSKINYPKVFEYVLSWIITLLSFYSVILLVFPSKMFKKTIKYGILFLLINFVGKSFTNTAINQIIIVLFILLFCYFFSNKQWKYILYGVASYVLNVFIQFIFYNFKIKLFDYSVINHLNKFIISFDFFIVMAIIIIIKEIIIKNKKEKSIEND